ncbi:TetR/AcrR family transcriptional regulator [soil metagenome]
MNERSELDKLPDAQRARLPELAIDATARRILEVALRMFAMRGFHATSMRELAKGLEIQPSALYASFPSKDHLLAEIIRRGHEFHLQALRAALLEAGDAPAAQLAALVRANVEVHVSYPHLAVVINDELHALPSELAAAGFALRRQGVALLTEIIVRGLALGTFNTLDPMVTIASIGAMTLRLPYWYRGTPSLAELATAQIDLALRMLGVAA